MWLDVLLVFIASAVMSAVVLEDVAFRTFRYERNRGWYPWIAFYVGRYRAFYWFAQMYVGPRPYRITHWIIGTIVFGWYARRRVRLSYESRTQGFPMKIEDLRYGTIEDLSNGAATR